MRSLLYQPSNPFPNATLCQAGRQEQEFALRHNGFMYRFTVRDKIALEDSYIVLMKAVAFAIKNGTPYPGAMPPKNIRDFLIKTSVLAT